jgi:hypothetical protein
LEGEVEVGDDLGVGAEAREEGGGEVAGFEGREAEAVEAGYLGAEGVDQVGEGRCPAEVGKPVSFGLAAAEGGGVSVGAEEDAGEDELGVAGGGERAGFGDRVVDRFAPEGGAELGDDAVGAVGVAAVLDLEEGALVGGLAGVELGEGGGAGGGLAAGGAGIRQILVIRFTRILIVF